MSLSHLLRSRRARWLGLLLVWAAFGAIVGASLLHLRQVLSLAERNRLSEQARIVDVNLQHQLAAVNAALLSVVKDLASFETQSGPSELTKSLHTMANAMPGVRLFVVLDAAGRVVASDRAEVVGKDLSDREYVQAALSNPSADLLYLSRPFRTPSGVYSVSLSRVSLTQQGKASPDRQRKSGPGVLRGAVEFGAICGRRSRYVGRWGRASGDDLAAEP